MPDDLSYPETDDQTTMARVERAQLAALLELVGADAPTLCAGWTTHHLVAHLVTREASPLNTVRRVIQLNGDDQVADVVASRGYDELVESFRAGPPRLSLFGTSLTDRLGNSLEMFVHHEDVRRAQTPFTVRELPAWANDQLWSSFGFVSKALMRKAPVGVVLRRSDTGAMKVATKGDHSVVIEAMPGELALFGFGRSEVASVTFDGGPDDVALLNDAHFTA